MGPYGTDLSLEIINFSYLNLVPFIYGNLVDNYNNQKSNNKITRIKADRRIGPHNIIVLNIIYGSLLGDAHAERRNGGLGTRISFYQESTHVSYLLWLHNLLSLNGYCNKHLPKIQTRLGHKGIVRKMLRFHT